MIIVLKMRSVHNIYRIKQRGAKPQKLETAS